MLFESNTLATPDHDIIENASDDDALGLNISGRSSRHSRWWYIKDDKDEDDISSLGRPLSTSNTPAASPFEGFIDLPTISACSSPTSVFSLLASLAQSSYDADQTEPDDDPVIRQGAGTTKAGDADNLAGGNAQANHEEPQDGPDPEHAEAPSVTALTQAGQEVDGNHDGPATEAAIKTQDPDTTEFGADCHDRPQLEDAPAGDHDHPQLGDAPAGDHDPPQLEEASAGEVSTLMPVRSGGTSQDGSRFLAREMAKPTWRCQWRHCATEHLPGGDPDCKGLAGHIRLLEAESIERKVTCAWGGCQHQTSKEHSSMRRHVLQKHLGFRAWRCPYCQKVRARVDTHTRHYRTCSKTPESVKLDTLSGLRPIRLDGEPDNDAAEGAEAEPQAGPSNGEQAAAPPLVGTRKRRTATQSKRQRTDEVEGSDDDNAKSADDAGEGNEDYRPAKRCRSAKTKGSSLKGRSGRNKGSNK